MVAIVIRIKKSIFPIIVLCIILGSNSLIAETQFERNKRSSMNQFTEKSSSGKSKKFNFQVDGGLESYFYTPLTSDDRKKTGKDYICYANHHRFLSAIDVLIKM